MKIFRSRLPVSIRKFVRKEKARLRRETLDIQGVEIKIRELIARVVQSRVRN